MSVQRLAELFLVRQPCETLAAGGSLAIVNRGSAPWDVRAGVVIDGGAGQTLSALSGMVGGPHEEER